MTEFGDLVAKEFETCRIRHAESVDVENPAAHAELADLFDHRHALESNASRWLARSSGRQHVAPPELESRLPHCARHRVRSSTARPVVNRMRTPPRPDSLERLHPLARDLGVWLRFAEPFPRRIQRDSRVARQRLEVREPSLRLGQALCDHGEEPPWQLPRERSDQYRAGRSG